MFSKFGTNKKFIANVMKAIDVIAKMKDRYLGTRTGTFINKNSDLTKSKVESFANNNDPSQSHETTELGATNSVVSSQHPKMV